MQISVVEVKWVNAESAVNKELLQCSVTPNLTILFVIISTYINTNCTVRLLNQTGKVFYPEKNLRAKHLYYCCTHY